MGNKDSREIFTQDETDEVVSEVEHRKGRGMKKKKKKRKYNRGMEQNIEVETGLASVSTVTTTQVDDVDEFFSRKYVVVMNILSYLDIRTVCRSRRVCSSWYNVAYRSVIGANIHSEGLLYRDHCLRTVIGSCRNIRFLSLAWCSDVDDDVLKEVCERLPRLRRLDLSHLDLITDTALEHFQKLGNLISLRMAHCKNIGTEEGMKHLEKLLSREYVSHSAAVASMAFVGLMKQSYYDIHTDKGKSLASSLLLSRKSPNPLESSSVMADDVVTASSPLLELDLSGCGAVNDTSMAVLVNNKLNSSVQEGEDESYLPTDADQSSTSQMGKARRGNLALKILNLNYCGITDDTLEHCLSKLFNLRSLSLRGCQHLSLKGLQHIAEHCHKLEELDVGQCTGIFYSKQSTQSIGMMSIRNELRRMFPHVKKLGMV